MAALLQLACQAAQTHPMAAAGLYSTTVLLAAGRHHTLGSNEWTDPHVVSHAEYFKLLVEDQSSNNIKLTPEEQQQSTASSSSMATEASGKAFNTGSGLVDHEISWLSNLWTRFLIRWYTMRTSIWTTIFPWGASVGKYISVLSAFFGKIWYVIRTTAYWYGESTSEYTPAMFVQIEAVWAFIRCLVSSCSVSAWEFISALFVCLGHIRFIIQTTAYWYGVDMKNYFSALFAQLDQMSFTFWTALFSYGMNAWKHVSTQPAHFPDVFKSTFGFSSLWNALDPFGGKSVLARLATFSACVWDRTNTVFLGPWWTVAVALLGTIKASTWNHISTLVSNGWTYMSDSFIAVHGNITDTASSVLSWSWNYITSFCIAVQDTVTSTASSISSGPVATILAAVLKNIANFFAPSTSNSTNTSATAIAHSAKSSATVAINNATTSATNTPQPYTTNFSRVPYFLKKAALSSFDSINASITGTETAPTSDYNWLRRGTILIPTAVFIYSYVIPKIRSWPLVRGYRDTLNFVVVFGVVSAVGWWTLQLAVFARDFGLLTVGAVGALASKLIKAEKFDGLRLVFCGLCIDVCRESVRRARVSIGKIRGGGAISFDFVVRTLERLIEVTRRAFFNIPYYVARTTT
jgi:hypothetical protein